MRDKYLAQSKAQHFTGRDGDEFYIRVMSGTQLNQFDEAQREKENPVAWLACLTLANEDGSRAFSDDEIDTVAALPGRFLAEVFVASCQVNRLRQEDYDALKKS